LSLICELKSAKVVVLLDIVLAIDSLRVFIRRVRAVFWEKTGKAKPVKITKTAKYFIKILQKLLMPKF
jgi:hypothetical protein